MYCVDSVMSLDKDIYTHAWHCAGDVLCRAGCDGAMCRFVDVRVLRSEEEGAGLPGNCGDGVEIAISNESNKVLGYEFF